MSFWKCSEVGIPNSLFLFLFKPHCPSCYRSLSSKGLHLTSVAAFHKWGLEIRETIVLLNLFSHVTAFYFFKLLNSYEIKQIGNNYWTEEFMIWKIAFVLRKNTKQIRYKALRFKFFIASFCLLEYHLWKHFVSENFLNVIESTIRL